jgi:hypothetical protein
LHGRTGRGGHGPPKVSPGTDWLESSGPNKIPLDP